MGENIIIKKFKSLIQDMKEEAFVSPKDAEDNKALGIMISQLVEWQPIEILKIMLYALEDSNAHSVVEELSKEYNIEL